MENEIEIKLLFLEKQRQISKEKRMKNIFDCLSDVRLWDNA